MPTRTLLTTVALFFGVGSLSTALAQPAVDNSPEAPPAVDESPDEPAQASGEEAGGEDTGGEDTGDEEASGEGTAQQAPERAAGTGSKQTRRRRAQSLENAEGQLPDWAPEAGLDPETEQDLEEGLPAWEPVAVPQSSAGGGANLMANWEVAGGPANQVSYPWVESHGYFRLRSNLFYNYDLDTYDAGSRRGSSPVLPPLTELPDARSPNREDAAQGHRYKRDADTLASANIRFRYQPTVHISENLRVKTTVDVLDNLVLGSTPDGGMMGGARSISSRPDVPFDGLSDGQMPPEAGINGYRDAVRVKHLWGEWQTPLGLLAFGRMQAHWGLGLVHNSGNCLDCNFGDSIDRIMGVTKIFDTYLALSWDFPSEGLVGFSGLHNNYNQRLGQAYDLDQRDDVNQYVVSIFSKPTTREELEVRKRDLDELRKPVLDWGFYGILRHQLLASETNSGINNSPLSASDVSLMDSKMFMFVPDLWLNFQYNPDAQSRYQLQFEAAAVIGSIDELPIYAVQASQEGTVCKDDSIENVADCPKDQRLHPRQRDLLQLGYALQFDAQTAKFLWGLHHGLASGDSTSGFGILDRNSLDSNDPRDLRDQSINNFKFDRDFIVDLILFREILGGVTNATYFKPYAGYNFIQDDKEAWGVKVAAIYSMAVVPESTPGGERHLGLELDAEVYIHEFDRFRWSLSYGVLLPFSGLNLLNDTRTEVLQKPGVAQTLQMNVGMQF